MIFVTVGTHEQPFDRLIRYMDKLKEKEFIKEEVIIQIGFSTYEPRHCIFSSAYPYQEMVDKMVDARIVITHGGPSSFMASLRIGKIPIVVPRQKKFGEHINDHQMQFVRAVSERYNNIIAIEDIECIKEAIINYNDIIKKMSVNIKSNNTMFNERFGILVQNLFEPRK